MLHRRLRWRGALIGAAALLLSARPAAAAECGSWPAWESFKTQFITADGRVVDNATARQHTVSEGQVYALFFALVGRDRASFERLLGWTENNLAAGDLTAHLPSWQWGRRDDGSWGVIDANSASDADLWLAYVLGEGGRLWSQRRWRILSALIGARILSEETTDVPGLGPSLLPAPVGFVQANQWRLNPSYVPLMLIRRMAATQPEQHWLEILPASKRLLIESAPRGFSPDWTLWQRDRGFVADTQTAGDGSYDAIRSYLWAGLLDAADPDRSALLTALRPMAARVAADGAPPEHVDTRSGVIRNSGNGGFSSALVPFLLALGDQKTAAAQTQRAAKMQQNEATQYYAQVLRLFSAGFIEGRYRFAADGRLDPAWTVSCAPSRPR